MDRAIEMGTNQQTYRYDIDGLRAVAVLLVCAFHINEKLAPGGFIGVDMFFVISGYLITRNIVRDYSEERFSFIEFYRRRIRRILPAMFFVTASTLTVGVALMLPTDVLALSWSAVASSLSAANVYFTFFLDTGYFAADSGTVPLLHMWSLGVEEQFYLLWPALLLTLFRWPRLVGPALGFLIVGSILVGEWQLRADNFTWAYYMLPSRIFELAAGGLIIFLERSVLFRLPSATMLPISLIGACMVAASATLLDSEDLFPGLHAVPIVFGMMMLLVGGNSEHIVSRVLSLAPMRWIGLVSYSLYLWHWPVLAFQRYLYGELSVLQQVCSIGVMLGLAWLTYRLVEKPARRRTENFRWVSARFLLMPLTIIGGAVLFLVLTAGLGPWVWTSYPQRLAKLRASEPVLHTESVCISSRVVQEMLDDPMCVTGAKGTPRVLIYGDSNAAHFVGFVTAIGEEAGVSIQNIAHSGCPPIFDDATPFVRRKVARVCDSSKEKAQAILPNFDTIVLAASWATYENVGRRHGVNFRRSLARTIDKLLQQGKRLILIGKAPHAAGYDPSCKTKALKAPWMDCASLAVFNSSPPSINRWIARKITGNKKAIFVDVTPEICVGTRCSAYIDSSPIYVDPGHLSFDGSYLIGERYAATEAGARLIRFLMDDRRVSGL